MMGRAEIRNGKAFEFGMAGNAIEDAACNAVEGIERALGNASARIRAVPEVRNLLSGSSKGAPVAKLSFSDKVLSVAMLCGSTALLSVLAVVA